MDLRVITGPQIRGKRAGVARKVRGKLRVIALQSAPRLGRGTRAGAVYRPGSSIAFWDGVGKRRAGALAGERRGAVRLTARQRAGVVRGGPPQREGAKRQVTLRPDPDVIDRFRPDGPRSQARMNAALRKAVGLK